MNYETNRAQILARRKAHYAENKARILSDRRTHYAALTPANKQRRARLQFLSHIKQFYRVSETRYAEMMQNQQGACACCGIEFDSTRERTPCVDHNRRCCPSSKSCGRCVRALLCRKCNRIVGIIEKNPHFLAYIQRGEKSCQV